MASAIAISLTVAGRGMFGTLAPTEVKAAEKNLLVNPGAEDGNLSGWVDPSEEKCWKVGWKKSEGGWDYPGAHSGKYYFMAGYPSTTKTYLYQDVSISSYEDSAGNSKTTKIGDVKNVKLINKKGNHIYLSYDSASGATGYQIRYSTNKSMKMQKLLIQH